MIVPVQIILIPMLPWFRTLGLNNGPQEYLGIALVHTAFGAGWAIFMLGAFFAAIPEDLLEAARIDGASWFDVFRRIALPLAVPGIVSFAIIDFVFVWNDLLLALTLLDREHQPLTVGLANLQTPHLAQEDLVSAGLIMAILPPLVLFAALEPVLCPWPVRRRDEGIAPSRSSCCRWQPEPARSPRTWTASPSSCAGTPARGTWWWPPSW